MRFTGQGAAGGKTEHLIKNIETLKKVSIAISPFITLVSVLCEAISQQYVPLNVIILSLIS